MRAAVDGRPPPDADQRHAPRPAPSRRALSLTRNRMRPRRVLFMGAIPCTQEIGTGHMRGLLGGYLAIGIIMLLIGFFATGPCPDKNRDIVSNVVFVLGWPVYLYSDVVQGDVTSPQWLHRQACEG